MKLGKLELSKKQLGIIIGVLVAVIVLVVVLVVVNGKKQKTEEPKTETKTEVVEETTDSGVMSASLPWASSAQRSIPSDLSPAISLSGRFISTITFLPTICSGE